MNLPSSLLRAVVFLCGAVLVGCEAPIGAAPAADSPGDVPGVDGGVDGVDAGPDAPSEEDAQTKCAQDDAALAARGFPRPAGWEAASHCKRFPGNTDVVFPRDTVQPLALVMTTEEHDAMRADLQALLGEAPPPSGEAPVIEGAGPDPCGALVAGAACRQGAQEGVCTREAGPLICEAPFDVVDGVAGSDGSLFARNPRTFHADVTFAGKTFRSVGLRYKGNSSLRRDDGERLPLRIEADAFEDEDPAVDDQRIFGFEALSFAPGAMDASRMHQVLASEVFRAHGVPAPLSTFVEVTLDFGAGPVSLGVYAMTEIPDKPLLDRDFGEHDGHLYKPEGKGAHLVTFDEASYDLESGDEATAYRDLRALLAALHAPQTDRAAWRTQLAATFDVDGFLQARAVNQAISNWDTYGALAHNFYLYTSEDGVTHFLPWDFDVAFDGSGNSDLAQTSFGGEWPLLQAIARDAVLATRYQQYLQAFYDDEMATGALWARAQRMAGVVAPALERESAASAESARAGLERLRGHIEGQTARVAAHLETFGRGAE